jgi:hypothetical protein
MTEKDKSTYHYWFPGGFLGTAGPLSAPNILRRGGARGAVACGWTFSNDSFLEAQK